MSHSRFARGIFFFAVILAQAISTPAIAIGTKRPEPTVSSIAVETNEDTAVTITLSVSSGGIRKFTYYFEILSSPSNGTAVIAGDQLTYTPETGFFGHDEFTYFARDNRGYVTQPGTVSITVDSFNNAPTANEATFNTDEDTRLDITVSGSDPEGWPLTYTITSNPSKGTLTGTAPNLTYAPNADFNGSDAFYFRVSDGLLNSPSAKITINIAAVNDSPTATSQTVSTEEDQAKTILLSGSDVDGDTLYFVIAANVSHGTVSLSGNQATYTPEGNFNGSDSFTFTVSDGTTSSDAATISVTVNPVNDPPVATSPQEVVTDQGTAVAFSFLVSDVDNDPLTITTTRNPAHGTLTLSGLEATYTPTDPNFYGQDLFTYQATDGSAISQATVNVTIQEVKTSGEEEVPDPLDWNIDELAGTDISTPLTNGSSVAIGLSNGVRTIFFTYTDAGGELILGMLSPDGVITTNTIVNGGVSPGALSAEGENVMVVYQSDNGSEHLQKVYVSSDGGDTGDHFILGDKGVGASVPTVCVWEDKGLVAWVAPPTDEDKGPLYVASLTNGTIDTVQQIGSETAYSAPSLSCSSAGQSLAVRYQPPDGGEITTHFAEKINGTFSLREVFKGADPSICASGDIIGIASHRGATVNFARSTDRGAVWEMEARDTTARFGNVSCDGDKIFVLYGDWPTTELAMTHDDATRALGAQISYDGGETFYVEYPAETDGYQGPASSAMDSQGIAIVLKDLNREVIRIITAYTGPTVPFVLSLHMEPHGSRVCDTVNHPEVRCVTNEDFAHNRQKMGEMIDVLNQYGLKATFEASPQWLTRLSETAEGQAVIQAAIDGGHEWALHHHGFDHNDWNGYSDNPLAYSQPHHIYSSLTPQPMSAYMEIVHAFETENNIQMITMEGTQLEYDWQEEWEFKTADGDEKDGWPLDDPDGVCPTGNPSWTQVVLPSISFEDLSLPAWGLTHTNFMGFIPACQKVKADNIYAYFDEVDLNTLQPTDAVNLVFHVEDYARDELTPEFDAFFEKVSQYPFIKGMTVSDYMCERVGVCD